MTKKSSKTKAKSRVRFTPNMDNFKTSLAYEGMNLSNGAGKNSIAELKLKYAG